MSVRLEVANGRLTIERVGAGRWFGRGIDVALSDVLSAAVADPAEVGRWNKGIRLAGIQIPGVIVAGIFRSRSEMIWWDVGRRRAAVELRLRGDSPSRIVVDAGDPQAVLAKLAAGGVQTRVGDG